MEESWVEPTTSATVNTIISMAGSASEAIITSRLEPMPPKLVPTSRPASARTNRALPSSAKMTIRAADHLNGGSTWKDRTTDASTHTTAKTRSGKQHQSHQA